MKIIFLDINGVLDSHRTMYASNYDDEANEELKLDPIAIGLIDKLCQVTEAKIVVSSVWRMGRTCGDFKKIFKHYGFDLPVFEMTPILTGKPRGAEVQAWIDMWESDGLEPIESYVILDDDGDFTQYQPLVQTKHQDGFLFHHFILALHILDPESTEVGFGKFAGTMRFLK